MNNFSRIRSYRCITMVFPVPFFIFVFMLCVIMVVSEAERPSLSSKKIPNQNVETPEVVTEKNDKLMEPGDELHSEGAKKSYSIEMSIAKNKLVLEKLSVRLDSIKKGTLLYGIDTSCWPTVGIYNANDGEVSLGFDTQTGKLCLYMTTNFPPVPEHLMKEDGLTKQDAEKIIKEYLEMIGAIDGKDVALCAQSLKWKDLHGTKYNDLDGARWEYFSFFSYNGIPVEKTVSMKISAYSGKPEHIVVTPFTPPKSLVENITKEQAEVIAREFLDNKQIEYGKLGSNKKTIVGTNFPWDYTIMNQSKGEDNSWLSWDMTFQYKNNGIVCIAIDCATGKVLGVRIVT